ncbi:GNAT family N-acetyltransferase [Haladaptatus sp. DYF46]|uniref:GNAT family N-acetyltransferase n=1 Tax=Haladaptatus sp. DYF46 TaxID=2886041 RepID=UPI001E32A677|nr:GNAT family N-acetyltransferase [Haladaptatus sp. DYF46]
MRVRNATTDDVEAVRAVHAESIAELGREGYDERQVAAWAEGCESAEYTPAIEADAGTFVVAEDVDVVAFGTVRFEPPKEHAAAVDGEVTGVYVHPSVARTGVGSAVLAELERRASEQGTRTLGLAASLNAVPFYEAHRYERVRECAHEFSSRESTGVTGTVVEMKKKL